MTVQMTVTDTVATPPWLLRVVGAHLAVALVSLAIGGIFGLFQALNYSGIDLYRPLDQVLPAPVQISYYEGLTVHGVLLALVFTTFFICGFLLYITDRALAGAGLNRALEWGCWWAMLVGLVLAVVTILSNHASVLYTFYPPLKAAWGFYVGLALVVLGTWPIAADMFSAYRRWQRAHPGARSPLPAFMAVVTMLMWVLASLGIVFELVFQLIPWSFGLFPDVDPLLNRTLFWFTGHPIVYFWLLPAYISWYTLIPRQAGGRLFSDAMARFPFLLFLAYSIPVGIHHQFEDPGISEGVKLVQAFFTFIVFFPSLLTAFALAASLESAAWAKGDRRWFAWVWRVPWGDPSLAAQLLAMLLFVFGGVGGLILSSYNLNLLVHNTSFIVGHFHITVGAAFAITTMGICYWLVPYLAGRPLWSRRLGQVQVWSFALGMALFSFTQHYLGVQGMPRRTDIATATYAPASWHALGPLISIGGAAMAASALLFFLNLIMTVAASPRRAVAPPPFAEYLHGPEATPALFDRLGPWLVITVVLILIAYVPPFVAFIGSPGPGAPGVRPW